MILRRRRRSARNHSAREITRQDSPASRRSRVGRRLRLKGHIQRIEHTHTYTLTPDGQRLAIFYTKLNDRLLHPLLSADQPQAPPQLRNALATIDHHVQDYIAHARLKPAT